MKVQRRRSFKKDQVSQESDRKLLTLGRIFLNFVDDLVRHTEVFDIISAEKHVRISL